MDEKWTILKVLQWTTDYFARKGIDQARANAEVLLAHILGTERIQLYLRYDQPLQTDELTRYREVVQRKAAREPTQYITGKQEFWSLDLEVTPSVLIPRPETELLVERSREILGDRYSLVLDLGTGSGAIAIALAHECGKVRIVATDKSCGALTVARRNAVRHRVESRIHFAAMDLFSAFSRTAPPFELIISNPPYVGAAEYDQLSPEVSRYEPGGALLGGGPEGLDTIRKILYEVTCYLKPGGFLLMEIGQGQAEVLQEETAGIPHVEGYEFLRDYSGILRVLQLRRT